MLEKRDLGKYAIIVLIFAGLIGILFLSNRGPTGYAVYTKTDAGNIERGANWNRIDNGDGSYSLEIYNTIINYNNGTEYVPISYGSCGSNCFRDWNGLIYRVSNDEKKAYINLYDVNDNYISSFGFGITGDRGNGMEKFTTLNFSWTWTQEHITETDEYVFRAYNNDPSFNWTQEFHFYPNQSMKIKNTVKNNLGVNIQNAKFWYIQTVGEDDGIWFNGTRYAIDTYKTGEFDSLLPQIKFEDYYIFEYDDLLKNGFNITDFYLGDGGIIGVNGIRILAIGITKGNSVFPNGVQVIVDPTVTLQPDAAAGKDTYIREDDVDKGHGTDTAIRVGQNWVNSANRGLIEFNLSDIPEDATISSAIVNLYLYQGTNNLDNINVYRITRSWVEGTTGYSGARATWLTYNGTNNWATVGGDYDSNIEDYQAIIDVVGWYSWNVTNLVKQWHNGAYYNYGLLFKGEDEISDINYLKRFYSGDYATDPLLRPKLIINYTTDKTLPTISITYPLNTTYNINISELNYTVSDNVALSSCWYSLNNGQTNTTITCEQNATGLTSNEGSNTWEIWANDTNNNINSSAVIFFKDTINPNINIVYPQNNTNYSSASITINYTVYDNSLQSCWWTNNSGQTNNSITCGNNVTGTWNQGYNTIVIYANDSAGNINSSSIILYIDSISPDVNIFSPQNEANYGYNESLSLNFSVSDVNLQVCWYNINNGNNITLSNCANTAFNVSGDGSYVINVYANDSLGNLGKDNASFSVQVGAPTIMLTSPIDVYLNSKNIIFRYTPNDVDLRACELWGDFNGNFELNQTNLAPNNGIENSFSLYLEDGSYLWNIRCNDSQGNSAFNGNKTFYVDTIAPSLSLNEPSGTKTSRTIIASWSVSDTNLQACWYNVYRGASLEIANTSVNCSLNIAQFDVTVDASFVFNFYVNDSAGNQNSASSSFTVSTSQPPSSLTGGGGGGGGGGITINASASKGIEISKISNLIVDPGESKKIVLSVQNVGKNFLNDCKIKGKGENAAWISSEGLKGLSVGEKKDFIFTLKVPEGLKAGSYNLEVGLICQEHNESTSFIAEIIEKKLGVELIKTAREDKDKVKIVYALSELSGFNQEAKIEIILFGKNNERLAETSETKSIDANSDKQFETILGIPESLEGNFNLLINAISETSSTFVQEEIVLGASRVGGFAIFGGTAGDTMFSIILAALFIIFFIFILRRIFKFRKLKKHIDFKNK